MPMPFLIPLTMPADDGAKIGATAVDQGRANESAPVAAPRLPSAHVATPQDKESNLSLPFPASPTLFVIYLFFLFLIFFLFISFSFLVPSFAILTLVPEESTNQESTPEKNTCLSFRLELNLHSLIPIITSCLPVGVAETPHTSDV